jgi:hypothetical protein
VYDNQLRYLDGPGVTIRECLGKRFDLAELLNEPGGPDV